MKLAFPEEFAWTAVVYVAALAVAVELPPLKLPLLLPDWWYSAAAATSPAPWHPLSP